MVTKTAIIIPDTHIPFEDLKAYNLMLQVASFVNPDEITILGDYADFYAVSAHPGKHPQLPTLLSREVECVDKRLRELEKLFPKAKKTYIEGNHEYRLARYLRDKCPELFGYIDLIKIFDLRPEHKWKWINYGPEQKYSILNSKLFARHEPIGPSSKTTASRGMASIVFGHTHSIEENQVVALDGTNYRAMGSGWLGDHRHSAFDYVKNHAQWAHGFGVCTVLDNGHFFYNTVHIIDYKCCYGGKIFKA